MTKTVQFFDLNEIRRIKEELTSPESYFFDVNICNVRYRVLKSLVRKMPGSVLARLSYFRINAENNLCEDDETLPDSIEWRPKTKEFFVHRSPHLFDMILQYHIYGKLHMPNWACKDQVADEFAFWELEIHQSCAKCCGQTKFDQDDDDIVEDDKLLIRRRRSTYFQLFSRWGTVKRILRHFLEQPSSSYLAKAYAILSMLVIILSVVNFAVGTVPELQYCPNDTTASDSNSSNITDNKFSKLPINDYFDANGANFFSDCAGARIFQSIDIFCLIYFTIGLILRLIACRDISRFLHSPLHVIDVVVLIPFYSETILWGSGYAVPDNKHLVFFILRILQTIRVINIFKLARYSDHLKILALSLKYSKKEMYMLFLFVFIAVLTSSSVIYELEASSTDSQLYNMIISAWWSVVSLSTVGYGDIALVTVGGKIVGGLVCIVCIVIVAFPMAVLVEHFGNAYKKNKQNKKLISLQIATKQKEKKKSSMVKSTKL